MKKAKMVERACDVCSELFLQREDSDIAGKNGNWEKVFLCPKHQGTTKGKKTGKSIDFNVEAHVLECDVSYRGGTVKVDVSEVFPDVENAIMGAYQNYMGGGLLGAVVGAAMFDPEELSAKDQVVFEQIKEKIKKYFHSMTRHADDEWEDMDYETNQGMPVSAPYYLTKIGR